MKLGNNMLLLELVRVVAQLRPSLSEMVARVVHRDEDVIIIFGDGCRR